MRKISAILLALFFILNGKGQTSVTRLVGASPYQSSFWILDTSNFNIISTLSFAAINGSVVTGCTGMAKHPVNGTIYAVLKAGIGRNLVILNPANGTSTLQGLLGDQFSQISFTGNNALWGVTGQGGLQPESVFRINPANATNTMLAGPVNGTYGQLIRWNPSDNKMYHWAGSSGVFEKFDTAAINTPTNIGFTPANLGELAGAVYRSNNVFLISDLGGGMSLMNTAGVNTSVGTAPDALKGMAFVTCTRSLTASNQTMCAGQTATLTMNAGGSSYQWYRNGTAVTGATNQAVVTGSAGIYRCMITDNCGTDTVATAITLTVQPSPTVAITGNNYFCPGTSSITLTGTGGGTSQWYKNGVAIPGATTSVYTATAPGVYNMIKTNLNGCADSSAVSKVLANASSPSVNITAASNTLCFGSTMSMTASGASTYSWNMGATTATIIVAPNVTTTYSVLGTNTVTGCNKTQTITITVTSCVGLKELNVDNNIKIYPNPGKGLMNFEAAKMISSVEVFDLSGKSVMKKKEINATNFSLDLSSMPDAIYTLKIFDTDGNAVQMKAVVQH